MHEMSIAESLLELAIKEARKQGCDVLLRVRVEYGLLSGIMPEALSLCFSALVAESSHKNAKLELVAIPARLRCPVCDAVFERKNREEMFEPCPKCGEGMGYALSQGHDLVLAQIEACKSC